MKPELIEQRELLQVKLVLSIETKDVVKDVVKSFEKELSERQIVILEMIAHDSAMSAKAISEKMSEKIYVDERTIQRDLAKLKKLGILARKGGRKNGEWVIVAGTKAETF